MTDVFSRLREPQLPFLWKEEDLKPILAEVRKWTERVFKRVVSHFHHLHRNPELSWHEERTASYVEQTLRDLGLEPRRIEGTGVLADLEGQENLPRRALRADLDAVATHEATGLPHASENPGVMHACGHDAHTAMLLGAAEILAENPRLRRRPLRLIFQPAEESLPSGAQKLIEAGAIEGVADIVSLHVWPSLRAGVIGVRDGVLTAAADAFECVLRGPGGHGARPHETVDLITLAAQAVEAVTSLPRTHLDALKQPAVVSVGMIRGGESFNVIPDEVRFGGTVRTFDAEARADLPRRMETAIRNLAEAAGARYEFHYRAGPPALRNDRRLASAARVLAFELLGPEAVSELEHPSMGSEDFAYFTERIPGILLRLGSTGGDARGAPLHSSLFRVEESALPAGVGILVALALA